MHLKKITVVLPEVIPPSARGGGAHTWQMLVMVLSNSDKGDWGGPKQNSNMV